jgi:hypothetical protein
MFVVKMLSIDPPVRQFCKDVGHKELYLHSSKATCYGTSLNTGATLPSLCHECITAAFYLLLVVNRW